LITSADYEASSEKHSSINNTSINSRNVSADLLPSLIQVCGARLRNQSKPIDRNIFSSLYKLDPGLSIREGGCGGISPR
jgi:hypothetical protein